MKYIDIRKMEEKLSRSKNSIYDDIAKGLLPRPIKLGNRNLWPEPTVDAWLEKLAEEQGADFIKPTK